MYVICCLYLQYEERNETMSLLVSQNFSLEVGASHVNILFPLDARHDLL